MKDKVVRVLLVEDNPGDARLIRETLSEAAAEGPGFEFVWEQSLGAGLERFEVEAADVVLLDLSLPDSRGLATFRRVSEGLPETPIVVLTGLDDRNAALEAVRGGAQDYFVKGRVESELLARAIQYAVERKAVERDLRESQRLAQASLDALGANIAVLAADGAVLHVNRRWTDFARDNGLVGDPGVGNYLAVCDRAEGDGAADAARAAAGIRELLGGEAEEFSLEYTCHSPEERRWFELRATRFGGPGPLRVAVAHTDISDRRIAEAGLVRLSTAVEQAAETVMITDPAGQIEYVNPAFTRVTGYARDEVLGENPRLLKSGRQDAAFYADMWTTLTAGEVWRGHMVNRRKDASLYREECTISPVFDADRRLAHYVAVKRDVTQEEKLEEHLRQAQKMEAVGRLAGGVAHDFNNLLQVILGGVELLLEETPAGAPGAAHLLAVRGAGQRAADLTRQLLAFSRKQILEPVVLDLNAVVARAQQLLRRLIGEDVALTTVLAPDLSTVRCDPGQLEQVIMNLAVNARDAMPDGGRLTIETADVELDEGYTREHPGVTAGPHVLLAVSDTGCGMEAATLTQVFEPFFTTKGPGKGTGLGLSTAYGIVTQAGGHIQAASEPGRGSTFKVYLPADRGRPTALREPSAPGALPTGTETVLLVEDEAAVREFVARALGRLGYTVLAADGPGQALELAGARSGAIDLLLTDVVMPLMAGPKLADRLLGEHPHLRVLYMSGYPDTTIAHHGVLNPGLQFLQKPFSPATLARKVRAVLGH